jgi:phosphoglucomutase/phosphomannomutase
MTGLDGKQNIAKMLGALRANPPKEVGGLPVTGFEDLLLETGRLGPYKGETDKAARNFLIFRLGGGDVSAKVCLRPSGTEPKAKAYIEVCLPPAVPAAKWEATRAAIDAQTQILASEFLKLALATVGQTPAPGADKLSQ